MDAARARLGQGKTKSWNQRLQDTTFTKLQSFVKLKLQAICANVWRPLFVEHFNFCNIHLSLSLSLGWHRRAPARTSYSRLGGASLSPRSFKFNLDEYSNWG